MQIITALQQMEVHGKVARALTGFLGAAAGAATPEAAGLRIAATSSATPAAALSAFAF
jgi:hypothetical protein